MKYKFIMLLNNLKGYKPVFYKIIRIYEVML